MQGTPTPVPWDSAQYKLLHQHLDSLLSQGHPPERKSVNFVRWEKVCLPKSEGGLGLRRVREFNEACLLNLAWTVTSVDSLWAIWLRARYIKGPSIWHSSNSRNGSCIWKKLCSLSTFLQGDSRWVVGIGKSINLWFDNWIDQFSIASRFPYIQFSDLDLVADIIVELACLSWRLLHRKTPTDFRAKQRGWSMASQCYNCLSEEESDLHLFFSCKLAQQLWSWMFSPFGTQQLPPLSSSFIWKTISNGSDASGRKCAAAIFLHAISVLWSIRNDSKHNSRKSSLERAKQIFMDHIKGWSFGPSSREPKYKIEFHPLDSPFHLRADVQTFYL